jgi:hypothetical protein
MATEVMQPVQVAVAERPRSIRVAPGVIAGLAAFLVLVYASLLLPHDTFESAFIKEDRLIELPGSLGLLVASVAFFLGFLHLRRIQAPAVLTWLTLGLAAVFLFGFGEEISWGQRFLGIDTPSALEEINEQDEINVHNLDLFSGWLSADRMFLLFWVGFGVVVPLAAAVSTRVRGFLRGLVPMLPPAIALLLVANQLAAMLCREVLDDRYASIYPLSYSVFEIKESVISVLLAAGAVLWYRSLRRGDVPA